MTETSQLVDVHIIHIIIVDDVMLLGNKTVQELIAKKPLVRVSNGKNEVKSTRELNTQVTF